MLLRICVLLLAVYEAVRKEMPYLFCVAMVCVFSYLGCRLGVLSRAGLLMGFSLSPYL